MPTKATAMPFQPAPRPQPRVSPEQRLELAEAARDLGFGRTTSSPALDPGPEAEPAPERAQGSTTPVPVASVTAKLAPTVQPAAATRNAVLKFDIPEALWTSLRHEGVNRRVTVKYLILEALSEKGYQVDLASVPEDGRRQR